MTDPGAPLDRGTAAAAPLLGGLAPAAWDALAGPNFYSSAAWLGFCATDFGRDSAAAVGYRDGAPVCALPYVEADDSLFTVYRWSEQLAGRGLAAPPPRGILVGPREGYQTHVLGGDGARAEDLRGLVRQLRAALAEGGDPAERACVAMYLTTGDVLALRQAGVTAPPVVLDTDAWIDVPEGGWDAWLAGLPKKRRWTVRKERREFHEAGFRVEHVALADCWEQLGTAASATLAKHGSEGESTDELLAALRNHARCMGDAARTALLRDPGGAVAGFCLYYVWHGTVFIRWAGFDYDRLAGAGEYFNVVYYTQIERAPELGLRRLHAGVASIEAKALRGARLRPLWLLDLTEHSVLTTAADAVGRHNRAHHERLLADPRTAGAVEEADWEPLL